MPAASLALSVRFTATSAGTVDFVDAAAVVGYRRAAANLVDGKVYRYRAENASLSEWEFGYGIWTASTGTLARTTVSFSSTGAKVSFTAAPQVSIIPFVEDILSFTDVMSLTDSEKAVGRGNVYAAPFDALAYNGMQINGSTEVSQFNGANLVSAINTYLLDGWLVQGGGPVLAAQQVADAPPGYSNSIKVTVTTADPTPATGDYAAISQFIEGYRTSRLAFGTANAQPVSIGFWTKTHRTGTYSGSVRNAGLTRSYAFTFTQTVADTWQYNTATVPGDVAGTWVGNTNAGSLYVIFCMGAGTANISTPNVWNAGNFIGATGTTNGVAATTDVFQITGLTVLPGIELPSAARAPFIMRPFDQELDLCQRYLQRITDEGATPDVMSGMCTSTTQSFLYWRFVKKMRSAPSITFGASISLRGSGGASIATTSVASNAVSTTGVGITATVASGLVAGNATLLLFVGSSFSQADARL